MRATELKARTEANLSESRERLARFCALDKDAAVEALCKAFDAIRQPVDEVEGWVQLFAAVHPDAAVRTRAEELERELSRWTTELSLHREAYDVLSRGLGMTFDSPATQRFMEHSLRDFRRSGVDRDDATRAKLKELSEQMVAAGQDFDRNIIEDSPAIQLEGGHADLAGLPEDFLKAHPEDAQGRVTISTDPQDWMPFMSFADNAEARRALYMVRNNRAYPQNVEVLDRLLALRHEYATILGYENWATYAFEELMTREAKVVSEFVSRCASLAKTCADRELEEQRQLKAQLVQTDRLHEWDRQYLTERVKKEKHEFDAQSVRPYFPYRSVLAGVLDVAAKLYGVTFVEREDVELWHESVQCFEIREGDRTVARFYLDMHPRDGKFKHAAMFPLVSGYDGGPLPEACLVCNFTEPTSEDPGLLLHEQVTTIFHEFGHLLHHLYSASQPYLKFAGIATEWDFVEVPSQLFEEWAWNTEVLQGFAHHHETGEPIPGELVQRMRQADEWGRGIDARMQMFYASLSLRLHDQDPAEFSTVERLSELRAACAPYEHVEGTCFLASFGHLNSYSAAYYTYMWSLVIAKDLFTRFEGDLMSASTAREYRDRILGCGGVEDSGDLVRSFLGREYSTEAWEKHLAGAGV